MGQNCTRASVSASYTGSDPLPVECLSFPYKTCRSPGRAPYLQPCTQHPREMSCWLHLAWPQMAPAWLVTPMSPVEPSQMRGQRGLCPLTALL